MQIRWPLWRGPSESPATKPPYASPHFSRGPDRSARAGVVRGFAAATLKMDVHPCNVYSAECGPTRSWDENSLKMRGLIRCRARLRPNPPTRLSKEMLEVRCSVSG